MVNEENDEELRVLGHTLTGQIITAYLIVTQKANSDTENQEKKCYIVTEGRK
ncbi:hypothetical protein [Anaerorudis cellulosivorans]|uniref:hypothetical protein n=1 Tax=Anaerorudis cellulosivorans TaxID=3397862 RepID=UPI00221EF8BB|nr:hypothetical protein [Seramator thermalis]MCW1736205.1 hypothetical protein [Seramator thermalis]